jgi:hypothetical protein
MIEELPHFLRKSKTYPILVSVLCSEMVGRAALLPILRLKNETRIYFFPFVKNYNLMINIYLQCDK